MEALRETDHTAYFLDVLISGTREEKAALATVWELDWFARNRYDSARYKALLRKNGAKVVSATETISEGADGIILESVLEDNAEYYSTDLSGKAIRGMTENTLRSKFNGGTLTIGYTIDTEQHFQIDPLTAPFVLETFKRYAEGATMKEVRDYLYDQGLKNTRGKSMSDNSVQRLLGNRRYIGEYRYRDIVRDWAIPVIVTQKLFDRVQKRLAKNKKAPAHYKAEEEYLLTTKLFCGYSGRLCLARAAPAGPFGDPPSGCASG